MALLHCSQSVPRNLKKFDVLVKIVACGISAADCESNTHHLNVNEEYEPLGRSVSGIVQSIGSGVKTLRVGDNVAGKRHFQRYGLDGYELTRMLRECFQV